MMLQNQVSSSYQMTSPSPMRNRPVSTSQAVPMMQMRPTVDYKFHQHVSEELKKELEIRMILETKLQDAEEKLKEMNSIKIAYHNILADNQKLTSMIDSSALSSKNLETKLGILIGENEKLRNVLESKNSEFEKFKLSFSNNSSDLKKQNDRLRDELKKAESKSEQIANENVKLKREAENLNESQVEKSLLEEEIDCMRKELFEIQTVLNAQKEELDEYQELEQKSELLVMENQKLHTVVEELKEENSQLSQNLFNVTNRSKVEESMSQKYKEKHHEILALKEALENASSDIEILKEENRSIKEAYTTIRKQYESVNHQLLEKKHENDILKSKWQNLEHKLRVYENKEEDYHSSISDYQNLLSANDALANENKQMATIITDLESNLEAMRVNRCNQEALIRDYMQETDNLRRKVQEQQTIISRYSSSPIAGNNDAKYKKVVEENALLSEKVNELDNQVKQASDFIQKTDELITENTQLHHAVSGLEEQLEYWKAKADVQSDDREDYIHELESKIQQICEENEKIHQLYLEKCNEKRN